MILLLAFICEIFVSNGQIIVSIVYSSYTNKEFAFSIASFLETNFQGQFEFYLSYIENYDDILKAISSPDIIFDLSFSTTLSEFIKNLAEEEHFIIASINRPYSLYTDWEFFIHNSWENELEALSSIISYLNWETFIVISDETHDKNDLFYKYFFDKNCQWFFFSNNNIKNSSDLFIGKAIQASGIKNIVILNRGESANLLLKSLEEQSLLTFGTGVVLGSEGAWGLYGNGIVAYAESGLESADSYSNYEGLALTKFLNMMINFNPKSDPFELLDFLNKNTINHHPISNFTLLNIANTKLVIAGNIFNGSLYLWNLLIYPGGYPIIPNSPITEVNIWMASGNTNWGSTSDNVVLELAIAEHYALDYWNSIHALDGFEITVTHTDCGATEYNATYGFMCFYQLLASPAVGFLASPLPYISLAYIYTLRALNYSIPQISQYATFGGLESETNFPEFMRVAKSDKFNIQVIFDFLTIFNWKNVIVLYNNNSLDNYEYFVAYAKQFNVKIVNPPELRCIDDYYTPAMYNEWKWWFEGIIKLKARLVVPLLIPPYGFYVAESLYDTGMRRGDIIVLSHSRIAYSYQWTSDPVEIMKFIEIFDGSVIAVQAEWIGEYGEMRKQEFKRSYSNSTDFRCLAFDSAMLLLNGIKFTIYQGQNFKDFDVMNKNLRKQRFTGCSGTVSIEQGTNQRSLPTIGIYNVRLDDKTQTMYEVLVGLYDPGSVNLISIFGEILWYDRTTVLPTDLIIYENGCAFPKKQISHSEKGSGIFYGIASFFIVITVIYSLLFWVKLWKNIKIGKLIISAPAQFEDYILMAVVVIDFFQFISQGPDIGWLFFWLSRLCSYSMTNFDYSVPKFDYWIYLYTAMIISCYWVFSACIILFKLTKLEGLILRYVRAFAVLLLPIIGNIVFVPMVSVLLSIFQCDEGIGDNVSDSFIRHDCTVHCWKEKHILWAFFSLILLTIYIPLSIYFRYYYEILNEQINIRTKPIFILLKSIIQVTIIVMSQTIKIHSQSLHGLCCSILFAIFILLCFKEDPYNYRRMNFWVIISYFGVLWNFILSSIYWLTEFYSQELWITLQILIWAILATGGILIQWKLIPSLLLTAKPPDISIFFRFSIGSKVTADEINNLKKETPQNELIQQKSITISNPLISNEKDQMVSE